MFTAHLLRAHVLCKALHKHCRLCAQALSCVPLFETPWTVTAQAPLTMEFSRQEYWNGLLFPTSGDLPNPGIKSASLALPALAGRFLHCTTWEAQEVQQEWKKRMIRMMWSELKWQKWKSHCILVAHILFNSEFQVYPTFIFYLTPIVINSLMIPVHCWVVFPPVE